MKKHTLNETTTNDTKTNEAVATNESRRRQHLHLIIAQALGMLTGAALFACAWFYGSEETAEEEMWLLPFLSLAMMILFRLVTRLFQVLRMKLGRRLYDTITGKAYIAPRNILAAFAAYVIAATVVMAGSGYLSGMVNFALLAEGASAVTIWARVIVAGMMVLLTTVYLLYRDIHYVCTAGAGTTVLPVRKLYIIAMIALAVVHAVCQVL